MSHYGVDFPCIVPENQAVNSAYTASKSTLRSQARHWSTHAADIVQIYSKCRYKIAARCPIDYADCDQSSPLSHFPSFFPKTSKQVDPELVILPKQGEKSNF